MNLDNQRLRELQMEKAAYQKLLSQADTIADCLIYEAKLESLENEERDILRRCDVIV